MTRKDVLVDVRGQRDAVPEPEQDDVPPPPEPVHERDDRPLVLERRDGAGMGDPVPAVAFERLDEAGRLAAIDREDDRIPHRAEPELVAGDDMLHAEESGRPYFKPLRNPPPMDRGAEVFARIWRLGLWSVGETRSGPDSTVARTARIRREIPALLAELGAKSLLDAPCGDFNWMRHVDLEGIAYHGIDIVPGIIEANVRLHAKPGARSFSCMDLASPDAALPRADVVVCREMLAHLPLRDALLVLRNFAESGSTRLLATTFTAHGTNADCIPGFWRKLNLEKPPFSFPPPERSIREDSLDTPDKHLGLWKLADLPL